MIIIQAIVLGIIQGLTEFIPISSSAHLIIFPWLLRWNNPVLTSLYFDVALHLGTLLALLVFFASDWARLARAWFKSIVERKVGDDADRRMAWFLIVGCIPGGIAGFLLESKIDRIFHSDPVNNSAMIAMAIIIAVLGALLFAAEKFINHIKKIGQLSFKDALLIGLAQAFAVFPGVSRSGSTITAGLALGFEREAAARFSFLLSAPIVAGAGVKSLVKIFKSVKAGVITNSDITLFIVGFLAAAISGYLCVKFLLKFLQKNKVNIFAYYRWALAALILIAVFFR